MTKRMGIFVVLAALAAGCDGAPPREDAGSDASASDAAAVRDAFAASDAFVVSDAFVPADAFAASDAFVPADAFVASDAFVAQDAWTAPSDAGPICVDIFVSNTCNETVAPTSIDIPHGTQPMFCWHNRSADYPVDVWMSYGGGYTDLATGATWYEPVRHCLGPNAHDEYADISTACSSFRFFIHCL